MTNKLEITGVLLTGGESRRMGKNKAFLEIDGKMLIARSLEVLQRVCGEVVISSREEELYRRFGDVVVDVREGKGPLGGIYSVMLQAEYDHLFLAACDMPFLHEDAIRFLHREIKDADALVPYVTGRMHPLHAFYHKRILPLVEEKISSDKLRLTDVLCECRTRILKAEKCSDPGQRQLLERSVLNVNTPDEWEHLNTQNNENLI